MILFSPCSIPVVLCSNNWQSEISNAVNQPSASNHVANEPVGLNQVTPIPIVIQQIPDFDQDSWTANPPPGTEKGQTDSSITTQSPYQTNNNNNNNTLFTDGQAISHCSAANQAIDHVSTSNPDTHPTDQISALSRTASTPTNGATAAVTNGAGSLTTTTTAASLPSELSGTSDGSRTADAVASETMTTDDMAIETLTTNGMAAEPQTTNETASELPTINGEDVQESSTASQAVVQ